MFTRSRLRVLCYAGTIGCSVAAVCLLIAGRASDAVTADLCTAASVLLLGGIVADRRVREVRIAVKRRDRAYYDARRRGASGAEAWRDSEHRLDPAYAVDEGQRTTPSP
ncbi:hypothetical protein acdb102_42550 [Acidothermaceae bacterium B102]|nr:hypothetical protein acdb102_42550 [Acidothermaceae bacterium B102]